MELRTRECYPRPDISTYRIWPRSRPTPVIKRRFIGLGTFPLQLDAIFTQLQSLIRMPELITAMQHLADMIRSWDVVVAVEPSRMRLELSRDISPTQSWS